MLGILIKNGLHGENYGPFVLDLTFTLVIKRELFKNVSITYPLMNEGCFSILTFY